MRVFKVFVLLGGMGVEMKGGMAGEMKGGMTGGMKIEESLCLKGSAPSDGRDGALSLESQQKTENVRFLSMSHTFFNTLYFKNVPLLGTQRSLFGN